MMACRGCRSADLIERIDLGAQPVSNRFLTAKDEDEELFPLVFGQCAYCGLLQLVQGPPLAALVPRFDWIRYTEPESHCDAMTEAVRRRFLGPGSRVMGLTYKDRSVLDRFAENDGLSVSLPTPEEFGVSAGGGGLEALLPRLTRQAAPGIVSRHGRQSMVLARHVLEHGASPPELVETMAALAEPQSGHLLLEVPDCSDALRRLDHVLLWEEHTCYFTPATLRHVLESTGRSPLWTATWNYSFENCHAVVVKAAATADAPPPDPVAVARELALGEALAKGLQQRRALWRRFLERAGSRGPIAIYGAGHLAVAFLSYYGLADLIDFAVDDFEPKHGLFMPGTRTPIRDSGSLMASGAALCLMALSPEIEPKIVAKHEAFTANGGAFHSIFQGGPFAAPLEAGA